MAVKLKGTEVGGLDRDKILYGTYDGGSNLGTVTFKQVAAACTGLDASMGWMA